MAEESTNQEQNVVDLSPDELDNMSDDEFIESFNNSDLSLEPQAELKHQNNVEDNVDTNDQQTENQDNVDTASGSEENQTQVNDDNKINIPESIPDEYKVLFQPIKANGTEIQPKPDEMVRLIQLGSKYYADREKIKPQLKMVKMLERAKVDEDKLALALEALNGSKEAIAQLVKDKEINLDDVDELRYKEDLTVDTSKHRVSEQEITLEEIDNQLKSSPHYDATINILESIDEQSKNEFMKEPQKIVALNQHIENGLYELAMNEMTRGKMLGEYQGMSWIDAYEQSAQKIIKQYSNNNQQKEQTQQQVSMQQQSQSQYQQASNHIPSVVQNSRDSGTIAQKTIIDLNQMDIDKMSDDEFENLFRKQYGI